MFRHTLHALTGIFACLHATHKILCGTVDDTPDVIEWGHDLAIFLTPGRRPRHEIRASAVGQHAWLLARSIYVQRSPSEGESVACEGGRIDFAVRAPKVRCVFLISILRTHRPDSPEEDVNLRSGDSAMADGRHAYWRSQLLRKAPRQIYAKYRRRYLLPVAPITACHPN